MSQSDILEWLKGRRLAGDERFFSARDIEKEMLSVGVSVLKCRRQLNKLYTYKYLEIRLDTLWNRRYRLKRRYVTERVEQL